MVSLKLQKFNYYKLDQHNIMWHDMTQIRFDTFTNTSLPLVLLHLGVGSKALLPLAIFKTFLKT